MHEIYEEIIRPSHSTPTRKDFYRTLLNVSNILYFQRNLESLWKAITGHLKQIVPWERAGIALYHSELDAFRFYAVETTMSAVRLKCDAIIPREWSAMGWVYDHHTLHIRPNIQQKRVFLEDSFYCDEGLGRMINLPMMVGENCIGSLNIGSIESGNPDPENIEFLRQVATQIALAIDHARAYEEITLLRDQLARENAYLLEEVRVSQDFGAMVGNSKKLKKVQELAQAVAPTNSSVLIMGETGTGKELLARYIHELSPRRGKPFVRVNCAALPSGLVESELFGHEKGAFTGAEQERLGKFELADGGTLFLDEIGEMPIGVQAKLLRILQDGIVERVGSVMEKSVNVRIIAATNADVSQAIAAGRFRSDLYYRLHVFPIVVPPLRERVHDIPLLVRHFMEKNRDQIKRGCQDIEERSMELLVHYSWPGNVRELKNIIERAMILSQSSVLQVDEAWLRVQTEDMGAVLPSARLKDLELATIHQALEACEWRIDGPLGAAKLLGLHHSTFRSRLKKLGITRKTSV